MSWYEVESKVHVKNPKALKAKLKKLGKYKGLQIKKDIYYCLPQSFPPKQKLRVRDKGKTIEVNYKKSESYKQGVHAKKETEFNISDKANFIELIKHFGFEIYMPKIKRTELYQTKDKVNLELNHVKGLGNYLEIEILCKKSQITKARKRIVEIREQLGFTLKNVEKRGYTREIWQKKYKK